MKTTAIKFLPFIFITFFLPPPLTSSNNQTDLLSLLAFKSAIAADPQGALTSWNTTINFCKWNGIKCDQRNQRVVQIDLTSQGLIGTLSPHISNLSHLTSIILQNNSFHAQIPPQITLLTRLQTLHLSNNSFNGSVPDNLTRFHDLVYLNLVDNNLSGQIPSALASLPNLQVLALAFNNFACPIPLFLGNISSLLQLSLPNCNLTGQIPESFSRLRRLTFLQLGTNYLNGTVPSSLFNVSSLKYLGLNTNNLHGIIPSTIGLTLPNLKGLYLYRNKFSGQIPASISNATFLEYLEFNSNYFTGPVPFLGRLNSLQGFVFESNMIADDVSFISSLTNSTNLEFLQVGDNLLTGSLPHSVANLSKDHLSYLSLYMNDIRGEIPVEIGDLLGLTSVDLSGNFLEGPIPFTMAKLFNLHELFLGGNRLRDEIPSSFGNLSFLISLSLERNNLSGNVPSNIGNCTNLLKFDLSHNNFNGLIPHEIMSLSSLSIFLNLSHNDFVGPIPSEVGSLKNLGVLDMSNNRLSGRIPSTLGKCTSLQQLELQGNLLEGEIPAGLSALMGLQDLDLSRNNLSGAIPSYLQSLNLESLNLSFNRLKGEVPTEGVFKNRTRISVDGNLELCGGIEELSLPRCSLKKSEKNDNLLKILIPVLASGGIICVVCLALFAYKRRKSRENVNSPPLSSLAGVEFMRLSYDDLFKATDGFSEANLLGVGTFGSVYRGIIDDDQKMVAIKVFKMFVRGASKSFMTECNALRNVRHRNLLKILTVCESVDFQGDDFKALVYEFMANGSLENWLHDGREEEEEEEAKSGKLMIIQRLNIAIDIAHALEYLHFGTDSTIVHGDLKPGNILLDHDMVAHVGDFGLAKIISHIAPSYESSTSYGVRGTLGYVAPEYAMNNLVSIQGDMYSFGILLLEMFTNKRPTDGAFKDSENLHSFVSNALEADRVIEIVDSSIVTEHDMNTKDCIVSVLRIGVACSRTIPRNRMLITDVVRDLCKIKDHFLS